MQMRNMRVVLSLYLILSLAGCQHHALSVVEPHTLFKDELFQPVNTSIETPQQIFALPESTIAEVQALVRPVSSVQVKTDLLLNYLFAKKGNSLLYQNDATLTAAETLLARQANCLSLTILSYSLAQEMGLYAEFRDIKIPEYWTQNNGYSLLNGHVNLKIVGGKNAGMDGNQTFDRFDYVIDFDSENVKNRFPSRQLKRSQIVSMFYNNKAAEAMVHGLFDVAYVYLKAAVAADADASDSWNNLAVLYRHKQHYELAEQAYILAAQLAPDHLNPKANLAVLYDTIGEKEKAERLHSYVLSKRNQNPYYHIMLGNESLVVGEVQQAIQHFRKGLSLDKKSTEAMFGLAKAHLSLGMRDKATQYLQLAKQSAASRKERERYQDKLRILTTAAVQH
jgi:tetratricopeptide (TPR) repeat protein